MIPVMNKTESRYWLTVTKQRIKDLNAAKLRVARVAPPLAILSESRWTKRYMRLIKARNLRTRVMVARLAVGK